MFTRIIFAIIFALCTQRIAMATSSSRPLTTISNEKISSRFSSRRFRITENFEVLFLDITYIVMSLASSCLQSHSSVLPVALIIIYNIMTLLAVTCLYTDSYHNIRVQQSSVRDSTDTIWRTSQCQNSVSSSDK